MNKDDINRIFDKQIADNPMFEVYKELFNLTFDFDISDWRRIRTEKYWNKIDNITDFVEKKEYTLKCVRFYIENLR